MCWAIAIVMLFDNDSEWNIPVGQYIGVLYWVGHRPLDSDIAFRKGCSAIA